MHNGSNGSAFPPKEEPTESSSTSAMINKDSQQFFSAAVAKSWAATKDNENDQVTSLSMSVESPTGASFLLNPLEGAISSARQTQGLQGALPMAPSLSLIPKPVNDRKISWGVTSTSPIPPSYHLDNPFTAEEQQQPIPKELDMNLNDILASGADELEAETYILQAVERVAGQSHQRTHTETDHLFATIAEEEIKKSLQHTDNVAEEEEEEEGGDEEEETTKDVQNGWPQERTLTSQLSQTTMNSTRSRFQGLVKKQMRASTVEANLFSLTSALNELDVRTAKHTRKDSQAFDTTFTSADKLANAANQYLYGKSSTFHEEDTDDLESHASTSAALDVPRGDAVMIEGLPGISASSGGGNGDGADEKGKKSDRNMKRKSARDATDALREGVKEEWELFNSFLGQRKAHMQAYAKKIIMSLFLPSLGMACFLFYVVENPAKCLQEPLNTADAANATVLNGTLNDVKNLRATTNATKAPDNEIMPFSHFITCPGLGASASWWFLFLGVRQVITFTMALITQSLVIDYLALGSRVSLDWFGPIVTLLVVQSKGWPFILVFWAIYDLILLSGNQEYAHQWGYWQHWIDLFNRHNPSGNVVNNEWNYKILQNAIFIGVAVALKRLIVGLLLSRQTFLHYGEQLASLLKNMVLIGEVATLGKEIEKYAEEISFRDPSQVTSDQSIVSNNSGTTGIFTKNIQEMVTEADDRAKVVEEKVASGADAAKDFMSKRNAKSEPPKSPGSPVNPGPDGAAAEDKGTEGDPDFTESEQIAMMELLGAWEEPTTAEEKEEKRVTIGAVLQFRQSLTYMRKKYPFLPAFGPADTRDRCVQSSQRVYDRLLMRTPHRAELPFETLALLAKDEKGAIDQEKAKDLIRVFRPERDGTMGKLEFVKSIDTVYKGFRLLSANITNSSQMDAAVENLVNVVFYIILGAIVIYRLGKNPLKLFFSFSSVILAFAFMFGKSSAKYFDGCLFILVQRPYGVGDRIHLSNPMLETSPEGSSGWIVEKVSLFTTSVFWGATNERATLCNGAISNSRVINAARSPNATLFVLLKFGIDTPYEKIEIFKAAVEQYLKDRPREWLTFIGFRPTEVAVDKGFIGYKVIAQHRNNWQQIGSLIESKANLTTYCLEVAKQLEMRYMCPHLPVDLNIKEDLLDIPMIPEAYDSEFESSVPEKSSPKNSNDALTAFSTGLRQRKGAAPPGTGATDFVALVRMAMAANRNKNKGE